MVSENHSDISIAREQMLQNLLQIEDLAAVQERKRIAREIHDSLGNALTTLNVQLQTAHKLWNIDHTLAEKYLLEAQRLGAIAIQEVRQTVKSMREVVPLEQPLTELIDSLIQNFYHVTGIVPATNIDIPASLAPEVAKTLYRIIQEALTNICKYAEATKVEINLTHTWENLSLIIQDNGKGFKISQNRSGFGLQGMQERVSALKGNFNIDTEPGYGCWIVVNLPLEQEKVHRQPSPEPEYSLQTANQTSIAEAYVTEEFNLQITETTRIQELSALEFDLKSLDTTLLRIIPQQNLNLELPDTVPIAENEGQESFDWEQKIMFPSPLSIDEAEIEPEHSLCNHKFIIQVVQALAEFIGPIADFLVHKLLQSYPDISQEELIEILASELSENNSILPMFNHQEVIDKLSVHREPDNSIELNQQPNLVIKKSWVQSEVQSTPKNLPVNSSDTDEQSISASFLCQCEHKLAEIIGPIATFIVKKVAKSSERISRAELIKMLAAEIPEPSKAKQFQQRLLSQI
ncbi:MULTISPECIES: sensor histidine kinase [unclassified Tolypothrix]|uniref:sensor histidine kinase n=1 Tax=unclassified Tolypothrix TaxID=2649714 RepID=UPI000BBB8510|nr:MULTISPECIES: sensor histidine kinase [unclassified Tolypothrix]MBE9084872.1 sensor histidine kinase [Tolypothrix sp. LEGE 11397]UYD24281.1 sensor histidine kinase [Tolypothrix sp. PCC 7712]UYD33488.1 sensor histidine kinase [Tolypothrix sp. PCC 7601]